MGIECMTQTRHSLGREAEGSRKKPWRFPAIWLWRACTLLIPAGSVALVRLLGTDVLLPLGIAAASLALVLLNCVVGALRVSNALHNREVDEARALRLAVIAGAAQVDLLLDNLAIIARQARKEAADAAMKAAVIGRTQRGELRAEADDIRMQHALQAAEAHHAEEARRAPVDGEPQEAEPDDLTVVRAVPEVPSSRRIGSVAVAGQGSPSPPDDSDGAHAPLWSRMVLFAGQERGAPEAPSAR